MPLKFKRFQVEESDYVTGVDLGINNTATLACIGRNGTVKARKFINPARDIDQRDKRRMMIAARAKKTRKMTGEKFQKGFCKGLYRKSSNINEAIAARYWYKVITKSKHDRVWEETPIVAESQKPNATKLGKSSQHTQRLPVTLSSLWKLSS